MTRSLVAAFLVALMAGVAFPASAAGQTRPEDDKDKRSASGTTASAPRKTGLGGAKVTAPERTRIMPRHKIKLPKPVQAGRKPTLKLPNVRSQPPRKISGLPRGPGKVPELLPSAPEPRPQPERPIPQAFTPDQIRALLLTRGSEGARRAFQRVTDRRGIDADIGPRIHFRQDEESPALNAARQTYGSQGYTEVQLGTGDVVFVRPRGTQTMDQIEQQKRLLVQQAAAEERRQRREWELLDQHRDDPCGNSTRKMVHTDRRGSVVDPFIRWGTSEPPIAQLPAPGVEAAEAAMFEGDLTTAISEWQWHLARDPEDVSARRSLAVTLLLAGQTQAGVDTLAKALATQPSLACEPFTEGLLESQRSALRRAASTAATHANRTRSPEAWFATAYLMHLDGRTDAARRVLQRAADAGMSVEIVREMELALEQP